mmetsp:Transcript_13457/g.20386  ORF Transcript_13457/g.20386 Transcript_13457/m.20386 type:complete len:276 (-) Transcript_13457:14-841(-)
MGKKKNKKRNQAPNPFEDLLDDGPVESVEKKVEEVEEEEEEEEIDEEMLEKCCDPLTLPNYVIQLVIKQKYIEERLATLSPDTIKSTHHNEKDFKRRTEGYWKDNKLDETGVMAAIEEQITLLEDQALTTTVVIQHAFEEDGVLSDIQEFCGEPHHYGVTDREIEVVERQDDAEKREKAKENEYETAQAATKEKEERQDRAALIEANENKLAEVQRQKDELLKVKHQPLRDYLMENVLPTLTKGIIEVCNIQPDDPVDFLAEYLFQQTPVNHTAE